MTCHLVKMVENSSKDVGVLVCLKTLTVSITGRQTSLGSKSIGTSDEEPLSVYIVINH